MSSPARAYLTQTLAGRYQLVEHLADGNFSHAFKAIDQPHNAVVAAKVLRLDAAVNSESALDSRCGKCAIPTPLGGNTDSA